MGVALPALPPRSVLLVPTVLESVPEALEIEQEALQASIEYQDASMDRLPTALNRIESPDESYSLNEDLSMLAREPSNKIANEMPPSKLYN